MVPLPTPRPSPLLAFATSILRSFASKEEFAQVALDEFRVETAFVPSSLAEPAAIDVFAQVHLVNVKVVFVPQAESDF